MNHAISVEMQFFFISVLWGAILLFVYDALRIIRRLIKHDAFFIAFEDLIFWVCASLFIFAMMYQKNDGIIRGFSVMGMAIGMLLYHYILSDFLIAVITRLIRLLVSPLVFIINKLKKMIKFLISKGKTASNFLFRRLKKWTESGKITLNKRRQEALAKRQQHAREKVLKEQKREEQKREEQKLKEQKLKEQKREEQKQKEKKREEKKRDEQQTDKKKTGKRQNAENADKKRGGRSGKNH